MDCSLPVSSVHGISQARILEWGCHFLLQSIFPIREWNPYFLLGRWILYHWVLFWLLLVLLPLFQLPNIIFSTPRYAYFTWLFQFNLIFTTKDSIFISYSIIPQYNYLICPIAMMYAGFLLTQVNFINNISSKYYLFKWLKWKFCPKYAHVTSFRPTSLTFNIFFYSWKLRKTLFVHI